MLIRKMFYLLLSVISFVLISGTSSRAQEIPDDSNTPMVDSIDESENLLDSNQAYKQQFDSLSKDGDWIKAGKADFIKDVSAETGENLEDYYPQNTEVIYVWRPNCATQYWNPYSNGRWVFSSYGWIWLSDYNWGWGPYNYGRWYCSNLYGWVWLPGRVWEANWVSWRCNNNYVGWYPTCPRIHWRGFNNRIYTNHVFAYVPRNWVFVTKVNFPKRIDNTTIVVAEKNSGILKNTQKVKTAIYVDPGKPKVKYTGPEVGDISKVTGQKISPKQVQVTNSKGRQYADENVVTTYKKTEGTNVKEISKRENEQSGYNGKSKENSTTKTGNSKQPSEKTKKDRSKGNNNTKYNGKSKNGTKEKNYEGSEGSNTEKNNGGNNGNSTEKSNNNTKGSDSEKTNDGSNGNSTDKKNDGNDGNKGSNDNNVRK